MYTALPRSEVCGCCRLTDAGRCRGGDGLTGLSGSSSSSRLRRGSEAGLSGSDALFAAIDMCKPGTLYRDLGGAITKHVNAQGFAVDKTYCGHGIGEWFHCAPNIPHYAGNKAKFVMKPGHCFTIEPMICEGTIQSNLWADDWTAVTKDGGRSAQFEHTVGVGERACEIFTRDDGLTNYMGLVLGPKGSSLKQMQEKYRCKIVVRGRGIQRGGAFDPDPSPDDDLPMHVSVTGPQDAVAFLEKEYHAMFTNAEKRREVKQRQMDAMVSGETQ